MLLTCLSSTSNADLNIEKNTYKIFPIKMYTTSKFFTDYSSQTQANEIWYIGSETKKLQLKIISQTTLNSFSMYSLFEFSMRIFHLKI